MRGNIYFYIYSNTWDNFFFFVADTSRHYFICIIFSVNSIHVYKTTVWESKVREQGGSFPVCAASICRNSFRIVLCAGPPGAFAATMDTQCARFSAKRLSKYTLSKMCSWVKDYSSSYIHKYKLHLNYITSLINKNIYFIFFILDLILLSYLYFIASIFFFIFFYF